MGGGWQVGSRRAGRSVRLLTSLALCPLIVPSILVRLLSQNAKTSSVVKVLGQFMQSLPQFPHQHREVGGLKISEGLSRAALLDSMVLRPQVGVRVSGWGRKKELSDAGKTEREGSPGGGHNEGPQWSPPGKQRCCIERPGGPLLWVLCQTQKKGHLSPGIYRPACHPHKVPWPRRHTMDAGSSFQPCPSPAQHAQDP